MGLAETHHIVWTRKQSRCQSFASCRNRRRAADLPQKHRAFRRLDVAESPRANLDSSTTVAKTQHTSHAILQAVFMQIVAAVAAAAGQQFTANYAPPVGLRCIVG